MSTDPSKTSGQLNSVTGTAQETLGNAIGSKNMASSGQERHVQGETEVKEAQTKGYAEGMMDQVKGYKDSIVGSVMGDKTQQASGNVQKETGEAKKEANK